jgi:hypothetical protein
VAGLTLESVRRSTVPKSHSRSRKPRKGGRWPGDPDRRVKYVLRYRRKGEEVLPQTKLVRRGARPEPKELAPEQAQLDRREELRRDRRTTAQELGETVKQMNTGLRAL